MFNIQFDYRFDTNGFFNDPKRRAALEAAADIWEKFIQDDLPNISAGHTVKVTNSREQQESIILNSELDDVLIFVGAFPFTGTKYQFAGGLGYSGTGQGSIFYNRPASVGSIFVNTDFKNWFFDPTPATENDINGADFIGLAVHEIGHAMGLVGKNFEVGGQPFFDGPNSRNVNQGNPIPLDVSTGGHIKSGVGAIMEGGGTYKSRFPSNIDLAILADKGFLVPSLPRFVSQVSKREIATQGNDTIYGTELGDIIDGLGSNDQMFGDDGNDSLNGGNGDDSLYGQLGNDNLNGGLNNDLLSGDQGDDFLKGNEGNDSLYGQLGNDNLNGGMNNDLLAGNEGNDFLNGGKGDDSLYGQLGNDTLNGGKGNDILIGDEGRDTFIFGLGSGLDIIYNFVVSDDTIQVSGNFGLSVDALLRQANRFSTFSEITLGSGNQITVYHNAPLTRANFIIV